MDERISKLLKEHAPNAIREACNKYLEIEKEKLEERMRIYRCDRCGSRYNEEVKSDAVMEKEEHGLRTRIDLCGTCYRELKDWLRECETWRIENKE